MIELKLVTCVIHNVEFLVPTTEDEFFSGELHEDVIRIQTHNEDFPRCKIKVKKTQN